MINTSIIDLKDFVTSVLKMNGFNNVIDSNLKRKLSGKLVAMLRTGVIRPRGEFLFETYGECFAYVDIYIKALSNMELDKKTFKDCEEKMRNLIISNVKATHPNYSISNSQIGGSFTDETRGYHVLQTVLQITII